MSLLNAGRVGRPHGLDGSFHVTRPRGMLLTLGGALRIGDDVFEVVRFHSPAAGAQELAPAANRPGLRHVALKVDDVRGVVDRVRDAGWETVGEIVDFENTFLLCYVRGPEGLIFELAERLDGAPG